MPISCRKETVWFCWKWKAQNVFQCQKCSTCGKLHLDRKGLHLLKHVSESWNLSSYTPDPDVFKVPRRTHRSVDRFNNLTRRYRTGQSPTKEHLEADLTWSQGPSRRQLGADQLIGQASRQWIPDLARLPGRGSISWIRALGHDKVWPSGAKGQIRQASKTPRIGSDPEYDQTHQECYG